MDTLDTYIKSSSEVSDPWNRRLISGFRSVKQMREITSPWTEHKSNPSRHRVVATRSSTMVWDESWAKRSKQKCVHKKLENEFQIHNVRLSTVKNIF